MFKFYKLAIDIFTYAGVYVRAVKTSFLSPV